jgi:hypothetical protein
VGVRKKAKVNELVCRGIAEAAGRVMRSKAANEADRIWDSSFEVEEGGERKVEAKSSKSSKRNKWSRSMAIGMTAPSTQPGLCPEVVARQDRMASDTYMDPGPEWEPGEYRGMDEEEEPEAATVPGEVRELSAEQIAMIEGNRTAALDRKKAKLLEPGLTLELMQVIENNRAAAVAKKQARVEREAGLRLKGLLQTPGRVEELEGVTSFSRRIRMPWFGR